MKLEIYNSGSLNFVEMNITGNENEFNKCDPESKYLDSVVFNLFADCFEKANNLYDYYAPTKFDAKYIVPLRNRLLTNLTIIERSNTLSEFQDYIFSKLQGKEFLRSLVQYDKNWTDHWNAYLEKLVRINKDLLDLVDFCIDEDRILWVIGY